MSVPGSAFRFTPTVRVVDLESAGAGALDLTDFTGQVWEVLVAARIAVNGAPATPDAALEWWAAHRHAAVEATLSANDSYQADSLSLELTR